MTYSDDFVFKIDVRDRSLFKILCPLSTRYYPLGSLGDPIVIDPDDFPLERFRSHDLTCTPSGYCTTLTFLDLISLRIPENFCLIAIPQSVTKIIVVDEWNRSWTFPLEWFPSPTLTCLATGFKGTLRLWGVVYLMLD